MVVFGMALPQSNEGMHTQQIQHETQSSCCDCACLHHNLRCTYSRHSILLLYNFVGTDHCCSFLPLPNLGSLSHQKRQPRQWIVCEGAFLVLHMIPSIPTTHRIGSRHNQLRMEISHSFSSESVQDSSYRSCAGISAWSIRTRSERSSTTGNTWSTATTTTP